MLNHLNRVLLSMDDQVRTKLTCSLPPCVSPAPLDVLNIVCVEVQMAGIMTRQDWCLPIIIIKPMNTVIENIHCMTDLLDNLMILYFIACWSNHNDQHQVKLIE